MAAIINQKKINELLSRGVEEIINKNDLEKKIKSGKKLRIKLGIDPTSLNIHIGRSIPLLKLRDFQELGHKIIFIIGDFTGIIGDTSDKASERPMLDEKTVKKNARSYTEQAKRIIDIEKCEIYYNSEWLNNLRYKEICKQADVFSINEFISRINISKRIDSESRVSLREVFYPLMQGYDSVFVKADVEVGGTDQRFNLLVGRKLQKLYSQESQNIIINPLIEGLDGRKMSSTWGNTINLTDPPKDMFGKIMSLQDELIIKYFILATRFNLKEVEKYRNEISKGANPKDYKIKLAKEIVKIYYSEKEAREEEKYFIDTFSKKEIPSNLLQFKPQKYNLTSVLLESRLVLSKSEARRVIKQGGIKIDKNTVKNIDYIVQQGSVLQKGKINFMKII